jgi:hypothetical protein
MRVSKAGTAGHAHLDARTCLIVKIQIEKEPIMKSKISKIVSVAVMTGLLGPALAANPEEAPSVAEADLYRLQADFHGAAAGAGADAATKSKHLADMLALWTEDGILVVGTTVYAGKGVPNTSTCEAGTLTLCDFFANHAGSFVLGRNWTSLTPTFLTSFEIHGKYADVYFECHYFDVATGVKTADVSYGLRGDPSTGQARKVQGKWKLSFALVGSPPLSSQ